jgi:hypothetical protein
VFLGRSPLPQPKMLFTWETYRNYILANEPLRTKVPFERWVDITREYMERLPHYVIARCPECGGQITEPVDTFSLNGLDWGLMGNNGMGWAQISYKWKKLRYCDHVRIISWFLNLNGLRPDDLFDHKQIYRPGPEVPSLAVIPATAPGVRVVMQHLPIGRFGDAAPTPRYSLYYLSYFASNSRAFEGAIGDYFPTYSLERMDTERDFDLARHARTGRLLWIDPDSPDQQLVGVKDAPFPYGSIRGERAWDFMITRAGIGDSHPPGLLARAYSRVVSWLTGPTRLDDLP